MGVDLSLCSRWLSSVYKPVGLPGYQFLQARVSFYWPGPSDMWLRSKTAGICKGTFEIVSKEVLWSIRGSYQTIWGPPLPNVTRHSGWWSSTVTPSIDQALHQFLTLLLILTLLPNLTFYLIARCFHRTFATGAACQQRTLTPPDTWSCPTLGLASVLMLRPISPELVLFLDFWVSNIPRYMYFCFCFDAPGWNDRGHIVLSCLSVYLFDCLSVCCQL